MGNGMMMNVGIRVLDLPPCHTSTSSAEALKR
jgi:hypothetical protein